MERQTIQKYVSSQETTHLHYHPPVVLQTETLWCQRCTAQTQRWCYRVGWPCSQPGSGLQAIEQQTSCTCRSMQSAGHIWWQSHSCMQSLWAFSASRGPAGVDISSPVIVPYSLVCVCIGTCKGIHHHNSWQLPFSLASTK